MNKQQDNEEIKENDPYLKALIFFSCFSPPRAPFLACCLLFTFRKSFPPPKILPCYLFFTIFLFLLKKNLSLSIAFQPLFDSLSFSFQIFLCFLAPATHKKNRISLRFYLPRNQQAPTILTSCSLSKYVFFPQRPTAAPRFLAPASLSKITPPEPASLSLSFLSLPVPSPPP